MQSINSFLNLLGKNYYSEFLINVNSETIDFDSYIILVKYNGTYFYELNNNETLLKRKEIITEIKKQYQQALNEIYSMLLSQDPSKLNSYLDLNIKAVKSHLNILKKDFYIDGNQSRYYSIVDDNPTIQDLETVYQENLKNEEIDIDEKVFEIISNTDFKKVDSFYYLGFLYQRYKTLSFLPFALFQIGKHFILELDKIKLMNKEEIKDDTINSKEQPPMKTFKDEYLNVFCKEISDERVIKECCFDLIYEGIIHYVPYLETEVIENLLHLGNDKRDDYLNFTVDKIKKTPFIDKEKINIDKWLKKYNVTIDEFPKFSNDKLNNWLKRYYNGYSETPNDLDFILDIQIDFYCYAAMVEANKMIAFLESKRTNSNNAMSNIENSNENETTNQLSVNQAVILLDRLGVFSSTTLENVPNTKKAKLISQLLGKNVKNVKTAIEKLELKPSAITPNYQKDIDKIERILDNLE